MKISMQELLGRLPGAATGSWPMGERFAVGFAHGSMSVELYAPRGHDPQAPHSRDELYFVMQGEGAILIGLQRYSCRSGDAFFVPAGTVHRFEGFSEDFATWVVFWGPEGGER